MEDRQMGEGRHSRSDEEQQEVEGHRLVARAEEEQTEGQGRVRRSDEEAPEVEGHRFRAPSEDAQRARRTR